MQPTVSDSRRIDQLDGLRGIAIVLVILNHLRLGPLFDLTPTLLQPLLATFLVSGKIGVSILFLLSGFLMATIYPQVASKLAFWQKRYTRIFPAFVAMCVALTIIRFFDTKLDPLVTAQIVLVVIAVLGLLWRGFMLLPQRPKLGKLLFLTFLTLQLAVILGYIFVLPLVPSSVFYLIWPKWAQSVVFFAVNSTVALPFGNYVPQLDGAYWSIVTEVSFYIFYPLLFLPIISFITEKKSITLGSITTLLAFPFFFGLWLLFSGVLALKMMQIYLGIYFAFGVAIGLIRETQWIKRWQNLAMRLPKVGLVTLCLMGVVGVPLLAKLTRLPGLFDLILGIIPVTGVFLITLSVNNAWSGFLRNRILMTLGSLSYALYLTHTIAIEVFLQNGDPVTVGAMAQAAISAIILMAVLAVVLHVFLELPYFAKSQSTPPKTQVKDRAERPEKGIGRILILGLVGFVFLIWVAQRVPVTLSARVVNVDNINLPRLIPLSLNPVSLPFVGADANLGMVLINLMITTDYAAADANTGLSGEQSLQVNLQDPTGKLIAQTIYPVSQLYETRFHPVGFPLDPKSKDKRFILSFVLSHEEKNRSIAIVNKGSVFRTVYFPTKTDLLHQPKLLLSLAVEKAVQPFLEEDTRIIFLLCGPLLGLLGLIVLLRKR